MSFNPPSSSSATDGPSKPPGRRRPLKHVLMTVGVLVVLGVLGGAGVIFSGFFNVAATVADSPPLRWMLEHQTADQ